MKTKIFSVILTTLVLTLVLLTVASAASTFTVSPTELTFGKHSQSEIIKVKNIGTSDLTLTFPSILLLLV